MSQSPSKPTPMYNPDDLPMTDDDIQALQDLARRFINGTPKEPNPNPNDLDIYNGALWDQLMALRNRMSDIEPGRYESQPFDDEVPYTDTPWWNNRETPRHIHAQTRWVTDDGCEFKQFIDAADHARLLECIWMPPYDAIKKATESQAYALSRDTTSLSTAIIETLHDPATQTNDDESNRIAKQMQKLIKSGSGTVLENIKQIKALKSKASRIEALEPLEQWVGEHTCRFIEDDGLPCTSLETTLTLEFGPACDYHSNAKLNACSICGALANHACYVCNKPLCSEHEHRHPASDEYDNRSEEHVQKHQRMVALRQAVLEKVVQRANEQVPWCSEHNEAMPMIVLETNPTDGPDMPLTIDDLTQ